MSAETFEQADGLVLSDLAQVKVLANPLRVRILELLSRQEMTTKQVAESLGEKPTKLYHHVEVLERAGLVRLTRTRQNRGTLEKYYRAIARAFTVDSGLFSDGGGSAADSPLPEMVAAVLERTREELSALMASDGAGEIESTGLLSFLEIHASAEEIEELRRGLVTLLKRTATSGDDSAGSGPTGEDSEAEEAERRYRLTLALFPIDRS